MHPDLDVRTGLDWSLDASIHRLGVSEALYTPDDKSPSGLVPGHALVHMRAAHGSITVTAYATEIEPLAEWRL